MRFVDRKAKYPGRWTMIKSDGTSEIITLIRNDEPVVEGTPMNANTLNTLSDVAGADIAREKAEAAATVALTAKDAAELAATSSEESKDAAAKSVAEMEDALCEQDAATDERLAAIEDALCELDAAVNK
jgi:hypothetical protein|nr:MAG TPA: hypothetical protein [Caudoviricetes sp.]